MDSENDFRNNGKNNSVNNADSGANGSTANSSTANGSDTKNIRGGPKTRGGKLRSSRNAEKEGYFGRELPITEADQSIVDKIVSGLRRQLKPNTTTKKIAFENIVACIRRCIVASRLEGRRMNALLADEANIQSEDPVLEPDRIRWFGSSRTDVRDGIRLLLQTEDKLRAGAKDDIDRDMLLRAFGPNFLKVLDMSLDKQTLEAMKIDVMIKAQEKNFGMKPPPKYESPTVAVDPLLVPAMVLAFVTERKSFLEDVLKIQEQSWIAARLASNSEFNPRFYASAVKDLQRAFDWYFELVDKGL